MIQSSVMQWTYKSRLAVLMVFHMLWGLALWFSISKYGLGISTDSVHLLFASLNLSEGRGLISFDGSFVLLWPPLYPILLTFVHFISGTNPFVSADILQAVTFLGLSVCLSILFLKIFPDNFPLAFAANVLSDVGVVMLIGFDLLGSDYLHLFFAVLFLLLTGSYIENRNPRLLPAMSAVGMLAMLQRYLGLAAIATGAAMVLLFTADGLRHRLLRGLLLGLSALPAGIWLFITSKWIARRAPTGFADNLQWFSKSILEWFFPAKWVEAYPVFSSVCLWIFLGGLVAILFAFSRRHKAFSPFSSAVFVYGTLYSLVLFGSASLAYFNKLGGRFLLPLYVPLVTLLVVAVGVLLQRAGEFHSPAWRRTASILLIGILLAAAAGLLRVSGPLLLQSHAQGAAGENAFNTKAWHENSALQYWLEHQPKGEYLLFSNYPDGIAFYTWHPTSGSPRRFSGPYGTEEIPLAQYESQLFSSGADVYVVWIEPNVYTYFYGVEELGPIAQIQPLFLSQDGGVYRLKPRVSAH